MKNINTQYGTENCPLRNQLRYESQRMKTYDNFPRFTKPLPLKDFAKVGLFYDGRKSLWCAWCWSAYDIDNMLCDNVLGHVDVCRKGNLNAKINVADADAMSDRSEEGDDMSVATSG